MKKYYILLAWPPNLTDKRYFVEILLALILWAILIGSPFLYPLFMVFELLLFAVLVITFFLSVLIVNTGIKDLNEMEPHKYMMAILQWWLLGNGLAFVVYLGVSALH